MKQIKNSIQKWKKQFLKAKSKPRSKRKSFLFGVSAVLGIFGVTLLAPVLPALAKDIPTSKDVCPASPSESALAPSKQIISGLSGAAGAICALAVSSGSFMIGAACGVVIVIGILKAQGK